MTTDKGASVYVSAAEREALANAAGLLSALLEAASNPGPELPAALRAVYSMLEKANKAERGSRKRALVRQALRAAEKTT